MAQAGLELTPSLLPQPPECGGYGRVDACWLLFPLSEAVLGHPFRERLGGTGSGTADAATEGQLTDGQALRTQHRVWHCVASGQSLKSGRLWRAANLN